MSQRRVLPIVLGFVMSKRRVPLLYNRSGVVNGAMAIFAPIGPLSVAVTAVPVRADEGVLV